MSVVTRSSNYLTGKPESKIRGCKLPSNRQVLSVFFFHHDTIGRKYVKCRARLSAKFAVKEALCFWKKARIPVRDEQHCIQKLLKIFERWQKLKKHSKRKTITQKLNEEAFSAELDLIFDIAHQDALSKIKIKEDAEFLLAQREKGRRGVMAEVDAKLARREARAARRALELEERIERENTRKYQSEDVSLEESDVEEASPSSTALNESRYEREATAEVDAGIARPHRKVKREILSPEVSATLDRTKLSDRNATFVLSAMAQNLGHDIKNVNISRSTIRRRRIKARKDMAMAIKEKFDPKCKLTVHFDGKLLLDPSSSMKFERLPVIVSAEGSEQLLGIPKLKSPTGQDQANAVSLLIEDWNIGEKVGALCFDTTSTNTGRLNGACVLIEQKLGKDLLHLACRHHVFELVAGSAFEVCLGPSSGPDHPLFKRLRVAWPSIDQSQYDVRDLNEWTAHQDQTDDILIFANEKLKKHHYRDDYEECLELAVIYLGGVPPKGIRFRQPGAVHQARWMGKILYCLKIAMFANQIKLSKRETTGLRSFCTFLVTTYIKCWFRAPEAISAPAHDLQLVKELAADMIGISSVSKACLKKFLGHLWYLSEELIALAFFDETVSVDCKRLLVSALNEREAPPDPPKRLSLGVDDLVGSTLDRFVTKNTARFFKALDLPTTFLDVDPTQWSTSEDYLKGQKFCRSLRVVNDTAERGVKLIEDYNHLITHDEDQKQFLLQTVAAHRKRFTDCNKNTILFSGVQQEAIKE